MKKIAKYFWNILISIDQLANTLLGGDPDETISSRTGKLMDKRGWAKHLAKFLSFFEKDHAQKSIEKDEGENRVVE